MARASSAEPGGAILHSDVRQINRPHRKLLVYYVLKSLAFGPLFPIVLLPLYLRYRSLRYEFGYEGISMRWGVLFRREIHLTYARIQDIHLRSNVFERWLGLARVLIQTASGSAKAEMTLEGILAFESLRDFIYERMRGAAASDGPIRPPAQPQADAEGLAGTQDLGIVLDRVAGELRAIRELLERDAGQ